MINYLRKITILTLLMLTIVSCGKKSNPASNAPVEEISISQFQNQSTNTGVASEINPSNTYITFVDGDIMLTNEIDFTIDTEVSQNYSISNSLVLGLENKGIFAFSLARKAKAIEILLNQDNDSIIKIGYLNKYGIIATFDTTKDDKSLSCIYPDYLDTKRIYIESSSEIQISSIKIEF